MAQLNQFLPKAKGKPRVDGQPILGGTIFVDRSDRGREIQSGSFAH